MVSYLKLGRRRSRQKTKYDKDRLFRIGALALLFFSGGGLDVSSLTNFSGSTSLVFLCLILLYLSKRIEIKEYELKAPLLALSMLFIAYLFKGASFPIWCIGPIFSGYLTLTIYKRCPEKFVSDLGTLCKWYAYYSLLAFFIMLFLQNGIRPSRFYRYHHFYYLFWYVGTGGPNFVNGLRLTGLGAEPGIWQMFLNFNLLYALYEKRNSKGIILAILAVIVTFSTTAYFNLLFIVFYYFSIIEKRIKTQHIIILALIGFIAFGIVYENIYEKLNGSSGLTRISDIYIGGMFLEKNPLWGIDPSITDNSMNSEFLKIKYEIWGDRNGGYIDPGYLISGLCSGIMWFILDHGIIFSSYLLYKYFHFPLIRDKRFCFGILIIILLTFMTEPYSRSGFFYFFLLGAFIKFRWRPTGLLYSSNK